MIVRRIAQFLRLTKSEVASEAKPDLRYADPSHDPKNRIKKDIAQRKNTSSAVRTSQNISRIKVMEQLFGDKDELKELTMAYLDQQGRKGDSRAAINQHVALALTGDADLAESLLSKKSIRAKLSTARQELKEEKRIGYSHTQDVWYSKNVKSRDLTEREQRFLAANGLGPGWRNISSKTDAIKWLHQNFTPDEFENFCIAILTEHCGVPVSLTEKRRISGADGGFDGTGVLTIDGKPENIALQVKRYAPDRQVGQDHCQKFVGALFENGWRHGIIITTGTFSDRLYESVKINKERGIWIELIDQVRLAEIMLKKTDQQHGFGLHRTERGRIYINENILKRAAGSHVEDND